ncbi:cell wall glucanase, partial [Aureobasidium melanogenum]
MLHIMYSRIASPIVQALILSTLLAPTTAQTYSSCNPLTQSGCSPDPALGKSVDIDFTSGASNEFTSSGNPTYDSNGAAFTISKSGDAPSISSKWYIMFGHVDFVVKAAPGTGIVSAAILQSDCLDEIDWEWLGGDNTQAQSNYFGKGITTTGYNRGAFHGADNNHDTFHTYSIDWTADQIVWSIDGATVRAMTQEQAESGQYPQTPMYVKLGAWAGGDPSNPEGTIQWAGGVTDYSAGPFTMYVKSVHVTDYSTGSQYSYSGTSGTWQSIVSTGGQINGKGNGTPVSTADAPAVTSHVSNSAPLAFGNGDNTNSVSATRTGWPWSGTATATAVTVTPSPSSPPAQVSSSVSGSLYSEVTTSYDDRGFPTVVIVNPAASTITKIYDSQGFPITSTLDSSSSDVPKNTPLSEPASTSVTGDGSVGIASELSTSSTQGQPESPDPATAPTATAASNTESISLDVTVTNTASSSTNLGATGRLFSNIRRLTHNPYKRSIEHEHKIYVRLETGYNAENLYHYIRNRIFIHYCNTNTTCSQRRSRRALFLEHRSAAWAGHLVAFGLMKLRSHDIAFVSIRE